MAVSHATALGDYLRSKRAQLSPEATNMPLGRARRVPGLRREELALLAGVSVDYYTRLEQGREVRPSDGVVNALGKARRLDTDAMTHLRALVDAARGHRRRPVVQRELSPSVRQMLDSMDGVAANVVSKHQDLLAGNNLCTALYEGAGQPPNRERNLLRLVLLNPHHRKLFLDWDQVTADGVAALRAAIGSDIDNPRADELVTELCARSARFAALWQRHDVKVRRAGTKRFQHPDVGEMTLHWDVFALPGSDGDTLVAYTAAAGSVDEERLRRLQRLDRQTRGTDTAF